MNKRILIGAGVLAFAVGTALWLGHGAFTGASASDAAATQQQRQIAKSSKPNDGATSARPARIAEARSTVQGSASSAAQTAEVTDGELSAEDEKLIDAIQAALDDEKFDEVKRLAEKLVDHPVAEVRQRAIEALQWFGAKALASLTPFLADADEDARATAMNAVEQALAEMESETAKLSYIESLFQIRNACDEDSLAMLAGQLKGFSDSAAVVNAAVRVIEANRNPSAVREMKEVYEFVTGEPYTTPDAAQKWLLENNADSVDEFEAQP